MDFKTLITLNNESKKLPTFEEGSTPETLASCTNRAGGPLSLLDERVPYVVETNPETLETTIVFSSHFLAVWRLALSYEGDPVVDFGMSPEEVTLWNAFVVYENAEGLPNREVEEALDTWAYMEVQNLEHPTATIYLDGDHKWAKG